MKPGRMYQIKNLSRNRINTAMRIGGYGKEAELTTENPRYLNRNIKTYTDGDMVACIGIQMRETYHYEKQPFYKLLTLDGQVCFVSKGARNKYFKLVKGT
jgi:hypothetical protein